MNDIIFISFYDGNELIVPKNNKYTRIDDTGRLYLDLSKEKDRAYLDMFLKMDSFTIGVDGNLQVNYTVIQKEYLIDGSAIFIELKKTDKKGNIG